MIALSIEIYDSIKKNGPTTSFTTFQQMCVVLPWVGLMWIAFLWSTVYPLYYLWKVVLALIFGQLTPFRKLTKLLRHAFLWIPKTILRQFGDINTPTWAEGIVDLVTKFCPCFELCYYSFCFLLITHLYLDRIMRRFGASSYFHLTVTFLSVAHAICVFEIFFIPVQMFYEHITNGTKLEVVATICAFLLVVCGVGMTLVPLYAFRVHFSDRIRRWIVIWMPLYGRRPGN